MRKNLKGGILLLDEGFCHWYCQNVMARWWQKAKPLILLMQAPVSLTLRSFVICLQTELGRKKIHRGFALISSIFEGVKKLGVPITPFASLIWSRLGPFISLRNDAVLRSRLKDCQIPPIGNHSRDFFRREWGSSWNFRGDDNLCSSTVKLLEIETFIDAIDPDGCLINLALAFIRICYPIILVMPYKLRETVLIPSGKMFDPDYFFVDKVNWYGSSDYSCDPHRAYCDWFRSKIIRFVVFGWLHPIFRGSVFLVGLLHYRQMALPLSIHRTNRSRLSSSIDWTIEATRSQNRANSLSIREGYLPMSLHQNDFQIAPRNYRQKSSTGPILTQGLHLFRQLLEVSFESEFTQTLKDILDLQRILSLLRREFQILRLPNTWSNLRPATIWRRPRLKCVPKSWRKIQKGCG